MSRRWFILADDLTGAADCAIAFARRGIAASVHWDESAGKTDLPVFSYDAGSRNLAAAAAADRHRALLEKEFGHGRTLFKKIDSTLRGQPAAETVAAIEHLVTCAGAAFGIFAPAFPDAGRTTIDGRVHVAGRSLEETELWQRDHTYPSADLVEVLATAGIGADKVPLSVIRGDPAALIRALRAIQDAGQTIAVCDTETNDDLRHIARAGLALPSGTFFIGSAGLAHALAEAPTQQAASHPSLSGSKKGILIVVGSLAAASRAGARALVAAGSVFHALIEPRTLLSDAAGRAAFGREVIQKLEAGQDVLVEIDMNDKPDMSLGAHLAANLGQTLAPAASAIGGLAATGGETASALLACFGVNGIHLVDEIEPGVALGLTLGNLSIPVATKAGAFGDEGSLCRIADRLRHIRKKGTLA